MLRHAHAPDQHCLCQKLRPTWISLPPFNNRLYSCSFTCYERTGADCHKSVEPSGHNSALYRTESGYKRNTRFFINQASRQYLSCACSQVVVTSTKLSVPIRFDVKGICYAQVFGNNTWIVFDVGYCSVRGRQRTRYS